jgi:hypothetical protein
MKKCLNCGKALVGKQEKYCSSKCNGFWNRINNKEKVKKQKRKYYENNREDILGCSKTKYQNNKNKMKEQSRLSYQKNKKNKEDYRKKYCEENKEKRRKTVSEYYQRNKEKIKKYSDQYHQNNKEERKKYYQNDKNKKRRKKRHHNRYYDDCIYRLNGNLSSSIRQSLKFRNLSKNGRHWEDLVGYTVYELRKHLESLFQPGMTWENRGEWHIDHIVPKSFFVYSSTNDTEFKYCWSLNNLQPLWAKDNREKNGNIKWRSIDK